MEHNKREVLKRTVVRVQRFSVFPYTALQINIFYTDTLFSNAGIEFLSIIIEISATLHKVVVKNESWKSAEIFVLCS